MYEITFITKEAPKSPGGDSGSRPEGVGKKDSIKTTIESLGGKIIKEEFLGRRKFAYPIKKLNAGFYETVYFEIEPNSLSSLEKKLSQNQDIVRFLLIKSEYSSKKTYNNQTEKIKEEIEKPKATVEKTKVEEDKKTKKTKIKTIEKKPITKSVKPNKTKTEKKEIENKIIKPLKEKKITTAKKEPVSEQDRLKKLEARLDELLKD